jgi:hypothetical protein
MPVQRPGNAIARLRGSIIRAVNPEFSTMFGSVDDDAEASLWLNDEDGEWYIREGFTQVGDTHILHPGSYFSEYGSTL